MAGQGLETLFSGRLECILGEKGWPRNHRGLEWYAIVIDQDTNADRVTAGGWFPKGESVMNLHLMDGHQRKVRTCLAPPDFQACICPGAMAFGEVSGGCGEERAQRLSVICGGHRKPVKITAIRRFR
jgi:hypothetical protein